jgi:hypothetical protein
VIIIIDVLLVSKAVLGAFARASADVFSEPSAGGRRQMTTRATGGNREGLEIAPLVRPFFMCSAQWQQRKRPGLFKAWYRSHFIGSTLYAGYCPSASTGLLPPRRYVIEESPRRGGRLKLVQRP